MEAQFGSLGEIRFGKMLDKSKNRGAPTRYLRNINVRWFRFDLSDLQTLRLTPDELRSLSIRDGDLLICEGGEPGRCAVWRQGANDFTYQKALHRVRLRSGIIPEFFMYQLAADAATGRLRDSFTGTTIKHLTGENLKRYSVRVAPTVEQRRVVEKLEALFHRTDMCRERLRRTSEILRRFREAVLEAAVSGRLTEEWRGSESLDGWKFEKASDVCEKVQSGGTPKSGFQISDGVPFLKVYNIVSQRVDFAYRPQYVPPEVHEGVLGKSRVRPGDVLMNIVGPPLGKVAIVPDTYPEWNINQAITLFRPGPSIATHWLYIVLCSGRNVAEILHETRGTVGQVNISLSQCRNFIIPVPPRAEQCVIVDRVKELFAMHDRLESVLRDSTSRVERTIPAILKKAFRGKLVPQVPGEKPASVMVERINAGQEETEPNELRRPLGSVRAPRRGKKAIVAGRETRDGKRA